MSCFIQVLFHYNTIVRPFTTACQLPPTISIVLQPWRLPWVPRKRQYHNESRWVQLKSALAMRLQFEACPLRSHLLPCHLCASLLYKSCFSDTPLAGWSTSALSREQSLSAAVTVLFASVAFEHKLQMGAKREAASLHAETQEIHASCYLL